MNHEEFLKSLEKHLLADEEHIFSEGEWSFKNVGFDRDEALVFIKALKHHGFKHISNEENVAIFYKEKTTYDMETNITVKIGKEFRKDFWFGFFTVEKAEKRIWHIGDTDYSNPYNPRTLTKRGWYTGD
jgi:hypothetical protein